MEVPDFVEPITGWRVWRVARSADGFRLLSALYPELWLPGRALTGICLARGEGELDPETQRPSASPHAAPGERCTCGVYAADSVAAAAGYLCGRNDAAVVHRALGEVALWGRVAVAEHGWRASRAYPSRLWLPDRAAPGDGAPVTEIADSLRDYGVPVALLEGQRASEVVAEVLARSALVAPV